MRTRFVAACTLVLALAACGAPGSFAANPAARAPGAAVRAAGAPANPLIDADFPDPMLMRAKDGWIYAYATGSDDGKTARRVSVTRSRDGVRWEAMREAMPAKPRWAQKKGKFWAPHVVEADGRYVMYLTVEPDWSESEHMRLAVLTAPSPWGPFVDRGEPMAVADHAEENLDAMALDDPATGRKWLYWGMNGEIVVRELAADRLGFAAGSREQALLGPSAAPYEGVTEGPWVVAHGGWYYLFYSGDDCCTTYHYAVSVARSRSATGPFERHGVVMQGGDRWKGPGHNAVFSDGGVDWLVYHAVDARMPTIPATGNVRRPLMRDRITWKDGWPVVGAGVPGDGR